MENIKKKLNEIERQQDKIIKKIKEKLPRSLEFYKLID